MMILQIYITEAEALESSDAERNLTTREIKALIAVVMMLCGSDTIAGDVKPDYIKKQLYVDKQETIPEEALVYNLYFFGTKYNHAKEISNDAEKTSTEIEEDITTVATNEKSIADDIKDINSRIKDYRKECVPLHKYIEDNDWSRMDLSRSVRKTLKNEKTWDAESYQLLKQKRADCDHTYSRLRHLKPTIAGLQCRMYTINKAKRGQDKPAVRNEVQVPESV
ncbi:unnamed protein product [Mucor hiemalis]